MSAEAAERVSTSSGLTPIWCLKANQLLGAAAFASIVKYLPVYYVTPLPDGCGLAIGVVGILGSLGMCITFVGQMFWSSVIDYLGEFKRTLVFTQVVGTATLLMYTVPIVKQSPTLIFSVAVVNTFMMSTGGSIIDALCMRVLDQYKKALQPNSTPRTVRGAQQTYGEQRLYSAVGWGGMSLIMGQIIDMSGLDMMFVGFAVIQFINISIVVFFMPSPTQEEKEKQDRLNKEADRQLAESGATQKSLLSIDVVWFFANLFLYGMAMCLIENFLFVFLIKDFDDTPSVLLGASTAVMCFFEIPVFYWLGPYLEKQPKGHDKPMIMTLLACQIITALRCWFYVIVPRDMVWLTILVSPLHGICFAAMWAASMEYAKRLSNERTLAKMTGLVNGIYYSISMGAGSLVWGYMVQDQPDGVGFHTSFYVDMIALLVWAVIWQIGLCFCAKKTVADPDVNERLAAQNLPGQS